MFLISFKADFNSVKEARMAETKNIKAVFGGTGG